MKKEYSVKPSIFAKADRKNITQYLEQRSVQAPIKFKQELEKYINIISQTPNIFAVFNAKPIYRHVVVFGSYVMFYRVDENEKVVFIYRIIHGAQDLENIL